MAHADLSEDKAKNDVASQLYSIYWLRVALKVTAQSAPNIRRVRDCSGGLQVATVAAQAPPLR